MAWVEEITFTGDLPCCLFDNFSDASLSNVDDLSLSKNCCCSTEYFSMSGVLRTC